MESSATDTINNIIGIGSGVSALLFTIAIVGWILSVILFFKIWGMTNDVREMKEMIRGVIDAEYTRGEEEEAAKHRDNKSDFWVWNKAPFRRNKQVVSEEVASSMTDGLSDNSREGQDESGRHREK